ncbi:hypothetical protein ANN_22776 [Periplaneta americana]|uniref:MADF domain-containing protein n=1 Tax=Periplaneta americana TaxID=6978 RepID=A0ABQ8SJP8_PERAM|nr:hypothetical protein ANN_22776 [Periplaneta americana]
MRNPNHEEDRDITYALFCSVLCIMEQVLFDEILILSVEENPHVYDKRRASYKDEKMKENTLLSVAASLNTDHNGAKWEYKGTVHQLFIDFKKAYDSVKREVLYDILIEFGIPKKLVRLIKMCLSETYSRVRIDIARRLKHLHTSWDNVNVERSCVSGKIPYCSRGENATREYIVACSESYASNLRQSPPSHSLESNSVPFVFVSDLRVAYVSLETMYESSK